MSLTRRTLDYSEKLWVFYSKNPNNYIFEWDDKDKNGYSQFGIAIEEQSVEPFRIYCGPEFITINSKADDHYLEVNEENYYI